MWRRWFGFMFLTCHCRLVLLQDFQICSWLDLLKRGFNGFNLTCDARPIRRDHYYRQPPAP